MVLLGFRRKQAAMTLCKSNEPAIQWFHIHDRITFATILNQTVYLSSARVSISPVVVPRLLSSISITYLTDYVFKVGKYPVAKLQKCVKSTAFWKILF